MAAAVVAQPPTQMEKPSATDNHSVPPSKVIHCRAVAEGCKETELVEAMKIFGDVKALKLMPKLCQGLVEFEFLESAIACVTYSQLQPILLRGRRMYVNYSKSTEISREFSSSKEPRDPTNILLLTIINVIHPVTVDTIKKICEQQNAEVLRIVIFHKNGLQAFVEFRSIEEANRVLQNLNGCDIYPGCCTLKIEFSKINKLNVHTNTPESYDSAFEKGKFGSYAPPSNNHDFKKLLPGAENYPGVQSILTKVMNGGSMHGNQNAPVGATGLLSSNAMDIDNYSANQGYSNFGYSTNQGYSNNGYAPTQPYSNNNYSSTQPYSNNNYSSNQNYMEPSQQSNYLDQYTSPFTGYGDGDGATSGGKGTVAMVYEINTEVMNCDKLYNLFCLYGNVVRIKVLLNKPGSAMVQYAEKLSTEMAIQYLNNLTIFGQSMIVSFSKHPSINDSRVPGTLEDGSPSVVDYHDSRNNRFKFSPASGKNDLFWRIHPPSKVLHYFNAPKDISEQRVLEVFESFKAEVPLKHSSTSKNRSRSASGLLEFSSISSAAEALILLNHVLLHKDKENGEPMADKPGAPFTFKLAFSQSDSINVK